MVNLVFLGGEAKEARELGDFTIQCCDHCPVWSCKTSSLPPHQFKFHIKPPRGLGCSVIDLQVTPSSISHFHLLLWWPWMHQGSEGSDWLMRMNKLKLSLDNMIVLLVRATDPGCRSWLTLPEGSGVPFRDSSWPSRWSNGSSAQGYLFITAVLLQERWLG